MGVCCAKEDGPVDQQPGGISKKDGPSVSIGSAESRLMTSNIENAMSNQRRLTQAKRRQMADHIISHKQFSSFHTVERFADHYSIKKEIGAGAFGSVKLGCHRQSGYPCAIKIIKKSSLMVADVYQELMKNELAVLEATNHPHITRIFELLEDRRNYYVIMELMSYGNLLD